MIGAKTLFSLLLAAGAAVPLALGSFRLERLTGAPPVALFVAGAFGVTAGTLLYFLGRLGERSERYLRYARGRLLEGEAHLLGGWWRRLVVGENRDGLALELGRRSQYLLCMSLGLGVGLAVIDARALELMAHFERGVSAASSSYCSEDEEKAADASKDPNAPGCALLRRAYALGYAKDLGDCGEKARGAAAAAVCTRRQRDEPFLHYSFRLLEDAWSKVRASTDPALARAVKRDLEFRLSKLDELAAARAQILSSAPHAAHHIFTNLPDPKNGAFELETCGDRYRTLAHRPPVPDGTLEGDSRVLEHVLGQLLFESSYEPSAGSCREYHLHWGAPDDACQQLAASPEAFLEKWHALGDVKAALDRQRLVAQLDALAAADPTRAAGAPPPEKSQRDLEPTAFVSFQCFIAGKTPGRKALDVSVGGRKFLAGELQVAPSPEGGLSVERYSAIATMLVSGFHYGGLLSEGEGAASANTDEDLAPAFAGKDFLLSRLHGLAGLDIYVGAGWLAGRADLLEVYPYERHLKNFVTVFRRQYARERGRL